MNHNEFSLSMTTVDCNEIVSNEKMFKNFADVCNRRQMGVVGGESNLIRQRLNSCQSLYNKQLYGHFGCVNALGIDKTGSWMASGGDDRRILIWNVEKALDENLHDPLVPNL